MNENGNFTITISSDEYTAHLTLKADPQLKLSLTDLGPMLKQHGVLYGIKKDVLINILEKYKKGIDVENALVAEGITPDAGVPPDIEYHFKISSQPKTDESGRINYREISKILNIKKGQLLAIKQKLKQPVDGITVTGKHTSFKQFEDLPLITKGDIIKDEQGEVIYYYAGVDGALKFENNTISVLPALDIPEDVDFNVGNIRFNGNVKIGRDVLPDFIIEAEGIISIWGSAIACHLKARDTIEVRAGIIGKNKGEAISGDDIYAAFVENATLKAGGDVYIKNGIIGGEVQCGGFLHMEAPRSRIVGCNIRAARGLTAHNVGSRFDISTCLATGVHPEKEVEYLKIKDRLEHILVEAKNLEKKYGRDILREKKFNLLTPPQLKSDAAKWELYRKDIQVIYQRMKQVEIEMYDYACTIRIKETLFPRVTLKIGQYKMVTTEEYSNVIVKFSEERNRLEITK